MEKLRFPDVFQKFDRPVSDHELKVDDTRTANHEILKIRPTVLSVMVTHDGPEVVV